MEYSASVLTLTFSTTRMAELSALHAGWCSFLFEAEWTSGLLNADRMNSSLQNFQRTAGNRTRNLPSCDAVPQPTVAPPTPPCGWRYQACVVLFGSKAEQAAPDIFRQYLVQFLSGYWRYRSLVSPDTSTWISWSYLETGRNYFLPGCINFTDNW